MDHVKKRKFYSDDWNNADDIKRFAFLNYYNKHKENGKELFYLKKEDSELNLQETKNTKFLIRESIILLIIIIAWVISLVLENKTASVVLLVLFLMCFVQLNFLNIVAIIVQNRRNIVSNRISVLDGFRRYARLYALSANHDDEFLADEKLVEEILSLEYELSLEVWLYIKNYKYNSVLNYIETDID